MKRSDLKRASRLADNLERFEDFEKEFNKKYPREGGLEMNVGPIEGSNDEELVQPESSIVVDRETGRKIAAAAREIIIAELEKLESQ